VKGVNRGKYEYRVTCG